MWALSLFFSVCEIEWYDIGYRRIWPRLHGVGEAAAVVGWVVKNRPGWWKREACLWLTGQSRKQRSDCQPGGLSNASLEADDAPRRLQGRCSSSTRLFVFGKALQRELRGLDGIGCCAWCLRERRLGLGCHGYLPTDPTSKAGRLGCEERANSLVTIKPPPYAP